MSDQLHLKWGWIAWTLIAAVAGAVCGVATLPARGAEAQPSPSPATTQVSANGAAMFSYNGIYYQPAFQNGVTIYATAKM